MRRVKIFDGFEFETGGIDFPFEGGEFLASPEFVWIASQAPASIVADGLVAGPVAARGAEIVHEVDDEMCAAALPREPIMLAIELVAIKSEAELHGDLLWPNFLCY